MMKKWTVINRNDGNECFEAEGETFEQAAYDALQQLGWLLVVPENEIDEDTDESAAFVRPAS